MKVQPSKQVVKNTSTIFQGAQTKEKSSSEIPAPKKQAMFDDLHARIAERAYRLYIEQGCREGCAEQDWLNAEREILNHTSAE